MLQNDGFVESFVTGMVVGNTEGYKKGLEEGRTQGDATGYTRGLEEGQAAGEAAGYTHGYAAGKSDGEAAGEAVGYDKGYANGKTDGDAEGYDRGYAEGQAAGGGELGPATDGATELYISIEADELRTVGFRFYQSVANGVTIDWGDGTTETKADIWSIYVSHTYDSIGEYVIRLIPDEWCGLGFGNQGRYGVDDASLFGDAANNYGAKRYGVILKKLVVGSGVTDIYDYAFYACDRLEEVYISDGVTTLNQRCFYMCWSLRKVRLPSSLTTISIYSFCSNYGLSKIEIPNGVTIIGLYALASCFSLQRIDLPESLKTLTNYAVSNSVNIREIHCKATIPPTLTSSLVMPNSSCKVYIPKGSLEAYSTAAYWSNIASRLIEE